MIQLKLLEYEPVEMKDINLENLEDKLILVTGTLKRGKQVFDSDKELRYFTGALYNGKDAVKLEATIGRFNAGLITFNFITSLDGVEFPISICGRVRKSKESSNEYVLVPHFLYDITKEGKELIIPFALNGPAIVDIKSKEEIQK